MLEPKLESWSSIRAACPHFFEPGALRFFGSRVCESTLVQGPGGVYFVTSERRPNSDERRMYTVRRFDRVRGIVETAGEFQAWSTRKGAMRHAFALAMGCAGINEARKKLGGRLPAWLR